jgi:hypothetical protein
MTRCIFAFALAFAGLIVMPPVPAQTEVRRQCFKSCTIQEITKIEQSGAALARTTHTLDLAKRVKGDRKRQPAEKDHNDDTIRKTRR